MAHILVTVPFLLLVCAYAVPAPANPKFTFVKDSAVGLGVAEKNSKAQAILDSSKIVETPVESPIDTGNNVPDVAVLDNVNAGAAFAAHGSIATGIVKNNKFKNNPVKELEQKAGIPFFG